ncbi:hypothetical protein [Nostoc sp. NMS4]|uniref:hypothetical protein n=1 Tax=Nostoc sp. NMS4 TaxID=2815390 RepID=UPI0025D39366|nr:hypothetical protein [Nostoc sp. NMS4]MBN3925967.1 hypothetical protein [Nostoc sp. NMS4]
MLNIAQETKEQLKKILIKTELYDKYYQQSYWHKLYISLFRQDLVRKRQASFAI